MVSEVLEIKSVVPDVEVLGLFGRMIGSVSVNDVAEAKTREHGRLQSEGEFAWAVLLSEKRSPLVMEAAGGNAEALTTLLETARPLIYRWALQKTSDPDVAEDVAQVVLLRVCKGISSFRSESKLSSWLYRITTNEVLALGRRESRLRHFLGIRMAGEELAETVPPEADRMDSDVACGVIRDVACALPPLQLSAFRLVDLHGLRPCEAARALGKTDTNIRSSLCRARKKIRELVRQARRALSEDLVVGRG